MNRKAKRILIAVLVLLLAATCVFIASTLLGKDTAQPVPDQQGSGSSPEIIEPAPDSQGTGGNSEVDNPTPESGGSTTENPSQGDDSSTETPAPQTPSQKDLDEHGSYYSKDDMALFIYTYGHLPDNCITKSDAKKLGWSGGSLEPFAPGKTIGGDKFSNYEKLLPTKKGRQYYECDIDTMGAKKRGAKRIVFSNDGLIYYTEDHYDSFELLYGNP